MGKALAILLIKAAEGGFGSTVQSVYWWLAGKKTYIGLALVIVSEGLNQAAKAGVCGECAGWAVQVTGVTGYMVLILGQVDGAVRMPQPRV